DGVGLAAGAALGTGVSVVSSLSGSRLNPPRSNSSAADTTRGAAGLAATTGTGSSSVGSSLIGSSENALDASCAGVDLGGAAGAFGTAGLGAPAAAAGFSSGTSSLKGSSEKAPS